MKYLRVLKILWCHYCDVITTCYGGMRLEHSSTRVEWFLQLMSLDNLCILSEKKWETAIHQW